MQSIPQSSKNELVKKLQLRRAQLIATTSGPVHGTRICFASKVIEDDQINKVVASLMIQL